MRASTNRNARMAIANRTRCSAIFFFSNLKSAFPCFRTRDPWKQIPQPLVAVKFWHPTRLFLSSSRNTRLGSSAYVCAHHAREYAHTHTRARALQRNRHARTWNLNLRCLNRFMEKGNFLVYDAYEDYNGVCKLFGEFFFFFFNVIVSTIF